MSRHSRRFQEGEECRSNHCDVDDLKEKATPSCELKKASDALATGSDSRNACKVPMHVPVLRMVMVTVVDVLVVVMLLGIDAVVLTVVLPLVPVLSLYVVFVALARF